MFKFSLTILQVILFRLFKNRKDIILTMLLLKKENEILKRHLDINNKKIYSNATDRFSISLIGYLSKRTIQHLTIVKPKTLLNWQNRLINRRWLYKNKKKGRPQIRKSIKNFILEMKTDNHLWGCRRISDELKKLGIELHHTTVNKIIQPFRKNRQIQPVGSWKKFLQAHWNSLFGMDFMTIDTLFGKRLYLLIILKLHSRKIVKWALTEHPSREFVRQRMIDFSYEFPENKYLIHDNAPQFTSIDYSQYDIQAINTALAAPNMNSHTERVVGSIRQEALDHFLLFSEKQARNIITEYVNYYNNCRPHQGIGRIPGDFIAEGTGTIQKKKILSGLHHHYYRSSA